MSRIASCFARGSFLLAVMASGCGSSVDIPVESGDDAATDSTAATDTAPGEDVATDGTGDDVTADGTPLVDGAADGTADGTPATDATRDSVVATDTMTAGDVGCITVTTGVYYVDPINGNDASTGASACAFKTLTRAVAFLGTTFGASVPANTRIMLRNKIGGGETHPIVVPVNTVIRGESSPQTVEVPSGATGFQLASPSSGLSNLVVDGKGIAHTGVKVVSGSASSTRLEGMTVTGMLNDGVLVDAGSLTIGPGVHLDKNGVTPAMDLLGSGLHVVMNGHVVINAPAGSAPCSFDDNGRNGVLVYSGELTLTGAPDLTGFVPPATVLVPAVTTGVGTVAARRNKRAGVSLAQIGTFPFLENVIDGVVSWNNTGAGIAVLNGTKLRVRNSVVAKNAISGIHITSGGGNGAELAQIDLGTTASPGKNILQTPSDGNGNAGLCIGNLANPTVTLSAKGNYFNGKDCFAAPVVVKPVLNTSRATCAGGIDVGIEPSNAMPQAGITVALDNCQNF